MAGVYRNLLGLLRGMSPPALPQAGPLAFPILQPVYPPPLLEAGSLATFVLPPSPAQLATYTIYMPQELFTSTNIEGRIYYARALKGPNLFLAGPTGGPATKYYFRAIEFADISAALPTLTRAESPTGTRDSVNVTFGLAAAPSPTTSLAIFQNGLRLDPATDYSVAGTVLTFTVAPAALDVILADYSR